LGTAYRLLKKGGMLITYTINSLEGLSMVKGSHDDARMLVKDILGTNESYVSKETLQAYFDKNEMFSFVDCREKNLLVQWILLQKK
jgi:hypothetical protein